MPQEGLSSFKGHPLPVQEELLTEFGPEPCKLLSVSSRNWTESAPQALDLRSPNLVDSSLPSSGPKQEPLLSP